MYLIVFFGRAIHFRQKDALNQSARTHHIALNQNCVFWCITMYALKYHHNIRMKIKKEVF